MLERQLERLRRSRLVDQIVVATSSDPSDDPICRLCESIDVDCYRGSLDDVLDRFYRAAEEYDANVVVRVTGDCPLIDPDIVDQVIGAAIESVAHYASNTLKPTFPDGLDVEVVRMEVLACAWREATLPSEREHVMPFIWSRPDRFKLVNIASETDRSHFRWTVDTQADYHLVSKIYEALYIGRPAFTTIDIYEFLEKNPELLPLKGVQKRNEGYERSVKIESGHI